jgi:subtilisin family serine protease
MAPARDIISLGTDHKLQKADGTSAAAPFVTGAIALLCSEFPSASAAEVKLALRRGDAGSRRTVMPPLLNAWAAYQTLAASNERKAS